MTSSHGFEQPLNELLSKLFDSRLTDDEQQRLTRLLQDDSLARETYHEHIALHAMLHWIDGQPEQHETLDSMQAADGLPVIVPAFDGLERTAPHGFASLLDGWPLAYLVASIVLPLCLLIGRWTTVSDSIQFTAAIKESPNAMDRDPLPAVVAQITGELDCRWAINSSSLYRRDNLTAGQMLHLASGMIEITYDAGAKVILQGPATYRVDSVGGYLAIGKLTARLEEKGKLATSKDESPASCSFFAVRTPTAVVTDLGTEFGVEVDAHGSTRSHVLTGTVRVETIARGGDAVKQTAVLHVADSAVIRNKDDADAPRLTVTRNDTEPPRFVRLDEFAKAAAERQPAVQRRRRDENIRRDSALVAFYDFQRRPESPNIFHGVGRDGETRDGSVCGEANQTLADLFGAAGNVLAGKSAVTSSVYKMRGADYSAEHITDQSSMEHVFSDYDADQRMVIHGFKSPLVLVRIFRGKDRVAQIVTVKSSLTDSTSLRPDDYETTLVAKSPISFRQSGYVDLVVNAPTGTQSLFLAFGDQTEYYPNGGWTFPAGVLTSEVQAFATAPKKGVSLPPPPHAWSRGRFPGTTSLSFGEESVVAQIRIPERLTQMTVATWLTVEVINEQLGFGTLAESVMPNASGKLADMLRWQINRTGEIEFVAGDYTFRTPSVLPWQAWRSNRWRHVAIVADPQNEKIRAYLDGRRIAESAIPQNFTVSFGEVTLGGRQLEYNQLERNYRGRMDELSIFSRAMSDREIGELYESGKQ